MEGHMQEDASHELAILYKKLEDDMNRWIFSQTNSLSFVQYAGKVLEQHLNDLQAARKLTEQWLESMDLPTRNDLAEVAKRIIQTESRLDLLEEALYQTVAETKEKQNQIAVLARGMKGKQKLL
jgi:BMFP domain-containing protein YqiC